MKKITLYIALFAALTSTAQTKNSYYQLPIDGPLSLSANYGELRSNHFHGGLDIRVGGVSGKPVYAVAEGYVSRIVVRPDGYGKALYITHTNGTTSLYGHLHNFSPAIQAYVENIQYTRQRFVVNEFIDTTLFRVKKGALIGNAGNTGSSGGAHLHFEIRETPEQIPVNVFSKGYYKVPLDTYPPTIRMVSFFSFRETDSIPCVTIFHRQTGMEKKASRIVPVPETFYIGIDAYDSQNDTYAKLGINSFQVILDKDTLFCCRVEDIPFDESLYVNSAIAYEEKQRTGNSLLKTHIEPGNRLAIYSTVKNNGLISLTDTFRHTLTVKVIDDAGNAATTAFVVKRGPITTDIAACPPGATWIPAYRDRKTTITKPGMRVNIPAGALYQSAYLHAAPLPEKPDNAYSTVWHIHTPETPLHRPISIRMAAKIPDSLTAKALIAGLSDNGKRYSAGGRWLNNAVETNIRSFGDFFVTIDTIPPVIKPLFANGANVSKQSQLNIKITDELSGIASYNAYIDGNWALMEYDAKNDMLIYTFDSKRIKRNKKHELLLTVTDNKQNTTNLQTYFVW